MSPDNMLADGEKVVLLLHPHVKTIFRPVAALALILAVVIAVLYLLPSTAAHLAWIRLAIGAAGLLAAITWFAVPVLRWRSTTYELTTRRFRLREGVVSRTGRDFPLMRISDVSFSHGPLDRMLGCGKLVIESPGEHGQLVLTEIPHVAKVQAELFQLVEDERFRMGQAGEGP